jgi:type III restriction enzyme
MASHVNNISSRLSLRTPQRQSLDILHQVMELAKPHKDPDLSDTLPAIRSAFTSVEEFERAFPSLCFALATGVGKTRLMGAFITYLFVAHGIRHFFVLAPNLTIYKKLITDFTPNTPKYVFQGVSEFAVKSPALVTGDNFEQKPQVLDLFERDDVVVNVFNIAKFNVRSQDNRKAWRLSEYLGQSYFEYLAGLDDLVMIMDEAHRYRASASMQSIDALKPVLGLELTATPQVERGNSVSRFKNIIFDYPLARAMKDGYVKEPAVATRQDFNASAMEPAALERLKLEDGVRIHEATKVELEVYAQQNAVRAIKPFLLVIARDTQHAVEIVRLIEDDSFFNGHYKGRVIQVHSGQSGAEKDENVERLLAVERSDEPTEIVVHVNMLKEGWDVANLYTIVPLRAADSRTLVEQSIGRGLRLPYGKRTGVAAVDRLTIVAHDRFQDIVDEANKGGYSFNVVTIGTDVPEKSTKTVVVNPSFKDILGIGPVATGASPDIIPTPDSPPPPGVNGQPAAVLKPRFTSPAEQRTAQCALDAIRKVCRDSRAVPGPLALASPEVRQMIVKAVQDQMNTGQLELLPGLDPARVEAVVKETTEVYLQHTIAIPRVLVVPQGTVTAGFHPFQLDMGTVRLQPVSQDILIQHLASENRDTISALEGGYQEERLEDYIVRGLIDFDDVSYDDEADLLYDLSSQFVDHLRSYLRDDSQIRNVLVFHQRKICDLIHGQMQAHAWEEASGYEAVVSQGFSEVRPQAFVAPADAKIADYRIPLDDKKNIRNMLFGSFDKCVYHTQKFDSDPERRFVCLLEKDGKVMKWFKPGRGVFQIRYSRDNNYEPDFVVETDAEKLLCEPKRADQLRDSTVLAKARAAARWCSHASSHELAHGGKPWRYLLIPHDQIADNMTLKGLAEMFAIPDQLNEADPTGELWTVSGASDRLTAQRREAAADQKGDNEEA